MPVMVKRQHAREWQSRVKLRPTGPRGAGMTRRPKRIPGQRNPTLDPTEIRHIQNAASASGGMSDNVAAIRAWRAAFSAWDWWQQRRRKRKAIAAYQGTEREQ